MAQHANYWSCSPFADWIRGTTKLKMGTSEEWHEWEVRAKRDYPVRWWIAEEGLGHLQDFVTWPVRKIYDIKYYINNRWISHTHALTAHPRDIKPGEWRDVGNRFLPCLFNELVDFVEIEQAWHHIAWNDEAKEKFKAPFWASGWFRWRTWRCPEAGIASLDWAMSLVWDKDWGVDETSPEFGKPTSQAIRAKEIKELYIWWTTVYPARPDPMDASGWSEYCDRLRVEKGSDFWVGMSSKSPETEKMGKKALKLSQKIEEAYDKEDEAMMIRLIKIRDSLWT
jgi:hypothetical protein